MITVEDALLFGEWLGQRFVKVTGGWVSINGSATAPIYTTRELWDLYQQSVLGKKPQTDKK